MLKTASNNNNNNNILTFDNTCSSNKIMKMDTSSIKQLITSSTTTTTTTATTNESKSPPPPTYGTLTRKNSIKIERRLSSTSESSVEPMDLGRTPTPPPPPPSSIISTLNCNKKLNKKIKLQQNNFNNNNNDNDENDHNEEQKKNDIVNELQTTPKRRPSSTHSQNDTTEEPYESADDEQEQQHTNYKPKNFDTKKLRFSNNNNNNNNSKNNRYNNNNRFNNHHFCHNNTVVEIESSDNPNSLRKKFRISTPNRNNNNNNNNSISLENNNNNKYCKNDNEVNNDDDIELNNNNNNEDDKRKLKINCKNNDKNNLLITIKKQSSPASTSSTSRRGSDDNDDHLSNNGSNGPGSGLDDDDCNNRTNQNESGFVDGSSHNLINSINSISSPESGGGVGGIINGTNTNNNITTSGGNGHLNNNNNNNSNNNERNNNINGGNSNNNNNEDIKYVCPICEVVSATPHEFTNHIRSHNYSSGDSENFTCRICSKVLSSASSLDRHVLVHTGERPFNCKYCHLTFTTNGNMHRHMRTHKQHPHQKRRSSNNNNNNNNTIKNNNNKDSNNINNKTNNNNINNKISNTNLLNANLNSNPTSNNNSTTILNLQLNNGISNNTTTTNTTATTTTTTNNVQINSTNIIQNGNIDGGGESYESEDGGCSTDSSASNNSSNCNMIRNYNGINSTKIITTTNNQNTINTTNNNNNNNNSFKRKSTDDDNINGIIKRRMKTINNNTIINENDSLNNFISSTTTTTPTNLTLSSNIENNNEHIEQQQQKSELQQKFCCPVCNRNDFINMPLLSNHMDNEHSDIPAKCRQCDVVFKTHNQLSAHRCCLTKQQQPHQQQQQQQQPPTTFMQGFKDLTFVEFNNEKFPFITNSLCEQNIRQSIVNPKFECTKCYLAFPCSNSLEIHQQDCNVIENKNLKPVPHLIDPQALILSNMLMQHPSNTNIKSDLPKDFSMQKMFNIQQLLKRKQLQQQQLKQQKIEEIVHDEPEKIILNNNNNNIHSNNFEQRLSSCQLKRSLSCESLNSNDNFNITPPADNKNNKDEIIAINHNRRDDFLAHFNLKNKSIMNLNENDLSDNINNNSNNNCLNNNSNDSKNIKQNSEKILEFNALNLNRISSPISQLNNKSNSSPIKQIEIDSQNDQNPDQKLQQQLQQNDSRDLADIQSILNVTSASSSNFLRNFEANVNTPMGSECGYGKDEEEAQDSFTAEFRKMKLRGEFPCKLCTAVFPNLRALKGHNRIHVSAAGNTGPYRCNMCLYSIHDKAALLRHMRTHNGDRPYECAVCNYAFTTKANCERHLRNRHSKTTREEVKRAIIYHPSEDSSCDDPTKKLHLFSSPDFDNDDELQINPKDRSTPVSHLKEILQSESTPKPSVKIQVKSLEKLIDKNPNTGISSSIMSGNNFQSPFENDNIHSNDKQQDLDDSIDSQQHDSGRAIDLSMDVLDLSKKSKPIPEDNSIPPPKQDIIPDALKFDLSQQWLLAQQQFFAEALPKMDANYLQLCRNLALPLSFNPFLTAFSPLLSNGIGDFSKFTPFMNPATLFGNQPNPIPGLSIPTVPPSTNENNINNSQTQHISPNQLKLETNENTLKNVASTVTSSNVQALPKTLGPQSSPLSNVGNQMNITPTQNLPQSQRLPAQQQQLQTNNLNQSVNNNGPVKMVIKNGVLMPKQKQRRYRTERPFICEHCSARFTLRSNMERHIKQQHPEFYAERQRSGQHVARGRGSSSNVMSHMHSSHSRAQTQNSLPSNHFGTTISDQVKYALLAQQLKARQGNDILHQALTEGSNGASYNNNPAHNNGSLEDDDTDSKLIIDEDDDIEETEDLDDIENEIDESDIGNLEDEQQDEKNDVKIKNLTQNKEKNCSIPNNMCNMGAKKVAETILEQAIKSGSSAVNKQLSAKINANEENLKIANNMISRAESVGKYLKEVASSSFKSEESSDLASVSKLVDNATNNNMSFNNYFKPNDMTESTNNVNHMEQSDEEGLVASGSASDNNSGAEESVQTNAPDGQQKKKSAYSLAPNRVPCPYCDRIFPWSSSLRRHILTHTGQKPFKCSHCPLLFTTKSNCDRHLLRKHGNVESAVSLYVPIDDMPDPVPMPKAVAEAFQAAKAAAAASNCNPNPLLAVPQQSQQQQQQKKIISSEENQETVVKYQNSAQIINPLSKSEPPQTIVQISSTDLPFKCHLCDSSFSERMHCLDHIKSNHIQEFSLLLAKGAIDTESDLNAIHMHNSTTEEDDKRDDGRGKYPDYANRKVICAFCVRRFWSTEDLRRHMRTHSGERPFQCEVCLRKFTLKHSMLRHMKKHNGGNHNNQMITQNSGSDCSDDEQPTTNMILANSLRNQNMHELLSKIHNNNNNNNNNINGGNDWHNKSEDNNDGITNSVFNSGLVNPATGGNNGTNSDLIGNLLGISDQSLLNKFLTNPGEAAKFFGVEK